MYRANDAIIAVPTKSTIKGAVFPAFRLTDTGGKSCAFRAYLAEFDGLTAPENLVWPRGTDEQLEGSEHNVAEKWPPSFTPSSSAPA